MYRCPMHPAVVQDGEGACPICHMSLVAVTAERASDGAIAVSADKQQVLGIAASPVQRRAGVRALRVPGRVIPDESRVYRVTAGIMGSISTLAPVVTGSRVRKNQVLGTFHAPGSLSTIQLYILNLGGNELAVQQMKEAGTTGLLPPTNLNLQQRFLQLEDMGVSALQREEIEKTKTVPQSIKIVSPATGFVLARNVSLGLKFERGMELYRIADLRRVWVVADVFPSDAAHVRAGMRVEVSAPEQPLTLPGTIAEVLPQFDAISRTLKVRVEVENRDLALRPDMFVEVRLSTPLPEALTVPADAVVDSGLTRTVYVETAAGVFEPRKVETGARNGDRVEIVSGLAEGERIATSGAFFLDSETRMRAAGSGAAAPPVSAPAPSGRATRSSGGAGFVDEPQATVVGFR
jgi:Cu(I)/Ag(I) efflux system membrane fusion protein